MATDMPLSLLRLRYDKAADAYASVTVEVKNGGDRVIEELEVRVEYLTPKGAPHPVDIQGADKPGRATYGWAYPVLVSSAHAAPAAPLKPGESRTFTVFIPWAYDPPELVAEKWAAAVGWARLAK